MSIAATVKSMFSRNLPSRLKVDIDPATFTPDLWRIEQYWLQNVFIYNELMQGCSQHSVLEGNAIKLGIGVTHSSDFVMWRKNLGDVSQAIILPVNGVHKMGTSSLLGTPSKVLGQVFTMRPSQLKKLDDMMCNGVWFKRKRIKIDIPYSYKRSGDHRSKSTGPTQIHTIMAHCYIGNEPYWVEQMDPQNKRFRLVKRYFPNNDSDPYYFYAEKNERTTK